MNIDITLERDGDRLKATASSEADEWGSQIAYSVWVHQDSEDPAQVANLVGCAVLGAGLTVPPRPSAQNPEFSLQLEPVVEVPERKTHSERDVVVDGDSEAMRRLLSRACTSGSTVRLDYTDAKGNSSHGRDVLPIALDWSGSTGNPARVLVAVDSGVRKTFYLMRINRAEIV